jgi:hypothetical protein
MAQMLASEIEPNHLVAKRVLGSSTIECRMWKSAWATDWANAKAELRKAFGVIFVEVLDQNQCGSRGKLKR